MKNIGLFLKNARVQQGRSIEDVSLKTKIHPHKLIAIEEGDESTLPAKVFYIGLVKSYARELKLNPKEIDDLCYEAFKEPELPSELPLTHSKPEMNFESQNLGRFQIPKSVVILLGLILALGLVTLIGVTINKMNSYSQEELVPDDMMSGTVNDSEVPSESDKREEPEAQEKSSPSSEDESTPEGDKIVKEDLSSSPSSSQSEPLTKKPTEVNLVETVPAPPKPKKKKKPEVEAEVDDSYFLSPQEITQKVTDSVTASHKLTINALEPIQVEVIWSDGIVQKMILKTQESKTLVFTTPIKVRVNNGGAVQMSYNSGPAKVPGVLNKSIELNYP